MLTEILSLTARLRPPPAPACSVLGKADDGGRCAPRCRQKQRTQRPGTTNRQARLLLYTRQPLYHCPRRPKQRSWLHNPPGIGELSIEIGGAPWNDRGYSRKCPRTGVDGIGSMPARISRYYSTPIACLPAANQIKSNGPRSWLP